MEHDLISRIGLLEDLGASCYDLDALTGVTGDERTLQEAIMQYPASDAVPVVRCKDCKFAFQNNGHDKEGCPIMDRRVWMNGSSFCSEGKPIDKQEEAK